MPRVATRPYVLLALSPNAVATALGISAARVQRAVEAGDLVVRTCGVKHRIAVGGPGGIQEWIESWPRAVKRKARS